MNARPDRVDVSPLPAEPFPHRCLDEITEASRAEIVQRMFANSSVIAMVGAPGGGKTALGIDLGLHVAAYETWFGLKVSGGPCIYFAAEAPRSVVMRARAAVRRKFTGRRLPFYIAASAPAPGGDLTSAVDSDRVIATIRAVESAEGTGVRIVVLDTLASCLGDGDETQAA